MAEYRVDGYEGKGDGEVNSVNPMNNAEEGPETGRMTANSKGSADAGDIPTGNHPPESHFEEV